MKTSALTGFCGNIKLKVLPLENWMTKDNMEALRWYEKFLPIFLEMDIINMVKYVGSK